MTSIRHLWRSSVSVIFLAVDLEVDVIGEGSGGDKVGGIRILKITLPVTQLVAWKRFSYNRIVQEHHLPTGFGITLTMVPAYILPGSVQFNPVTVANQRRTNPDGNREFRNKILTSLLRKRT